MPRNLLCAVVLAALTAACGQQNAAPTTNQENTPMSEKTPFADGRALETPSIEKRPVEITQHGQVRVDNYAWLRDENWQEVLRDPSVLDADIRAALEAENAYYDATTSDLEPLREALFEEMRGRIKEDDSSVPARDGDWFYWTKFREGGEYPVFVRAPVDLEQNAPGSEQIIYDGDLEGEGEAFFSVGGVSHSPDHSKLAYAVDRLGSEYYSIRIRDLETGVEHDEAIESADGGGAVWTADSSAFYYVERDDNQRGKWVKYHRLGDDPANDRIVYEEPDDGFFLTVGKTLSGAFIVIYSGSHTTSELRVIPAEDADAAPKLIEPRTKNVEYSLSHHGDHFYILTNADDAVDFKIVRAPVGSPGKENWVDWAPHEAGVNIVSMSTFKNYLVRLERANALPRIVISDYEGGVHEITFDEAAYSLGLSTGFEFETQTLRFRYESPATPEQIFDYDMDDRSRRLLKTQEIPSGHDPSLYVVERLFADAPDGAKIPVTILRLKSTPKDGSAPSVLYAYGSYGYSVAANFSTNILPLVDRGLVYAIAHVRGGSAMGRQWYLDGKRDKKINTFTDLNASADMLIDQGFTAQKKIVLYGGSAGGLAVGAAVNLRPELYAGVLGLVPFVDVLNTISDASLPLTPPEWDEWGNPIESEEEFGWIAEYSPYDNIQSADYPPIMATGGVTDFRVTYWEPAKWVARLRHDAKGGPFVLRMNLTAGHGGSAARFERLDERAHIYAFALKALGYENAEPISHSP
ncbi:MAG: S9 family peptidase [Pseudomonadota bacterium]